MIAQLLNREFLLGMTDAARGAFDRELKRRHGTRRAGLADEFADIDGAELQQLIAALEAIEESPERLVPETLSEGADGEDLPSTARPKDDFAYVPRDPLLSLVQSALDEYVELQAPEAIRETPLLDDRRGGREPVVTDRQLAQVPLRRTAEGRRVWGAFEVARPKILSDPRWAWSVLAMGWRSLNGRASFVDAPPLVRIGDNARIFLVGDWGSGLPRAQKVARQIRKGLANGDRLEQHVIHLGDVYYSGFESEYKRRFLNYWPVDAGSDVGSFSLNGNHDMYSGGHGYFDTCLADPRFSRQNGCSFFALQNDHWQILALDTSYEDGGLHGHQAEWAKGLISSAPDGVKNLLLSHHQLFSAHEPGAKVLGKKIRPVLETERVDGWFWGHEHRCIQYGQTAWNGSRVGFASCVGHGGIPEYLVMSEGKRMPPPWVYEYLKQYGDGWEPWDTFGHAVLELHGSAMKVRYIDEDGHEHHSVDLS